MLEGGEGCIRGGKSDKSKASGALGPRMDWPEDCDIDGGVDVLEDILVRYLCRMRWPTGGKGTVVKEVSAL